MKNKNFWGFLSHFNITTQEEKVRKEERNVEEK